MKLIERIKRDPRVADIWNEGEDGWWILLKPGYICGLNESCACHEFTLKALANAFETVKHETKTNNERKENESV